MTELEYVLNPKWDPSYVLLHRLCRHCGNKVRNGMMHVPVKNEFACWEIRENFALYETPKAP